MGYNGRVGPKALTGECPIRSFYPVGVDLRARRFARKCRLCNVYLPFDNMRICSGDNPVWTFPVECATMRAMISTNKGGPGNGEHAGADEE